MLEARKKAISPKVQTKAVLSNRGRANIATFDPISGEEGVPPLSSVNSERLSFLDSPLSGVPFQLLPHAVYSWRQQEKTLQWQEEFLREQVDLPFISILCDCSKFSSLDLKRFFQSLEFQSNQYFEVLVSYSQRDEKILRSALRGVSTVISKVQKVLVPNGTSRAKALSELSLQARGSFLLLCSEVSILHPQALFALAKQTMRSRAEFFFAQEVFLDTSLQNAQSYYRRSELSLYSLLGYNTCGDNIFFSWDFAAKTLTGDKFLSLSPGFESWHLAFEALQLDNAERISLALFYTREGQKVLPALKKQKFLSAKCNDLSIKLKSAVEDKIVEHDGEVKEDKQLAVATYSPLPADCTRLEFADPGGKVSVLIPFKNQVSTTLKAVRSILRQRGFEQCEIVLVNNNSDVKELELLSKELKLEIENATVMLLHDEGYFNFARLNNYAAESCSGEFLLLMNNDVELIGEDVISRMRSICAQDGVGAAGGKLLYADDSIQSAGINFASVRPMNVAAPNYGSEHFREVDAATMALLMVRRSAYQEVLGLDEFLCPNGFGDALFCKRLREKGQKIIYCPDATAYHFESKSRGRSVEEIELWEMVQSGLKISDLYEDFEASRQPQLLSLKLSQSSRLRRFLKASLPIATIKSMLRWCRRSARALSSSPTRLLGGIYRRGRREKISTEQNPEVVEK